MKKISALILAAVLLTMTGFGSAQALTTTPTEPQQLLQIGQIEDGVYSNPYAGIGCELDESWTYYTAEELQELPKNTSEALAGSELAKYMENVTNLVDMQAENAELLLVANVNFTKLKLTERLIYATLNEKQALETVLAQKDAIISSYEQAGIFVSSMEIVTVTYLGEEHYALKTVATVSDVPYYVLQIQNYRLGEFGMTLTASSYVEDNTQAILDLFYALDK